MLAVVFMAIQGFFPETFMWPHNSVGWIRFVTGFAGLILATILKWETEHPSDNTP